MANRKIKILQASEEEIKRRFRALKSPFSSYDNVAALLEVDGKDLKYWVYQKSNSFYYEKFIIRKKSGGERVIYAPKDQIKILQKKLNYVLQIVAPIKPNAHGFTKERSIITNAKVHVGQRYVLNFDLEDFFPSIHFGRVFGMFQSSPFNLSSRAAACLAKICCIDDYNNPFLPQGAPTSPVISNLVCRRLDSSLSKLAHKHGCVYTRYADDITFSTKALNFPITLAYRNKFGEVCIGKSINRILERNDFTINPTKNRLLTRNDRQIVTGLVVNESLNVKRKYLRQVRAMLYAWKHHGLEKASNEYFLKYRTKQTHEDKDDPTFESVVFGKILFIKNVREANRNFDPLSRKLLNTYYELIGAEDKKVPLTAFMAERYKLIEKINELKRKRSPQRRGTAFEKLLHELFDIHGLEPTEDFEVVGEQIDGAFKLHHQSYLIEAKWHKDPIQAKDLYTFEGKVRRKSSTTRGVFVSCSGFTEGCIKAFSKSPGALIVFLTLEDILTSLSHNVRFDSLIEAKVQDIELRGRYDTPTSEIVERIDELVLK